MKRFIALDSCRGICACLVAFMHFDVYSHFHTTSFNFYLFVDFFFVLSGFVISANYQQRLMRGFSVGRFMFLRFGRLYPLHLFTLACFVSFELLQVAIPSLSALYDAQPFTGDERSLGAIVANVLLIHSFNLFNSLTWNRPSWSIGTEFYAYLIFALLLVWLRKSGWVVVPAVMVVAPLVIALLSDQNMATTFDYGLIRCFMALQQAWWHSAFTIFTCARQDHPRVA